MVYTRIITSLLIILLGLCGCYLPIDKTNEKNACAFLSDNPTINQALLQSDRPIYRQALAIAIIQHESNHTANARPVKRWLIKNWIPWSYYSSARGYAQSTEATWSDFTHAQSDTPKRHAYVDNIRFINWYFDQHESQLGNERNFYEAYFLYHDGATGYHKKKYKRPEKLRLFAQKVARDAKSHMQQLQQCQKSLQWQRAWMAF